MKKTLKKALATAGATAALLTGQVLLGGAAAHAGAVCNSNVNGYTYLKNSWGGSTVELMVAHNCFQGHDGAWGVILNSKPGDSVWLDISHDGGADWNGLQDRGGSITTNHAEWDGPGTWIRACMNHNGLTGCTNWN
jgi:hypothetical protein